MHSTTQSQNFITASVCVFSDNAACVLVSLSVCVFGSYALQQRWYLAVNLAAPQGGLDDVEQSVRQALTLPHPPAGLLAGRTHIPVGRRAQTNTPSA